MYQLLIRIENTLLVESIVKNHLKDQVDYLWSLSLFGEFKGIKLNYKTPRNPAGDANGSLDTFYLIDAIKKDHAAYLRLWGQTMVAGASS